MITPVFGDQFNNVAWWIESPTCESVQDFGPYGNERGDSVVVLS